MKKIIFASLLVAAMGIGEVRANNFTSVNVEAPEATEFIFTYKVTYSTKKVGDCVVTYKHTTKYVLGCPWYTSTCVIKKDCSTPTTPEEGDTGNGGN